MPDAALEELLPPLVTRLAVGGLDLVTTVAVGRYNDAIPAEYELPDLGDPENPCLVIGNTRTLWAALAESPDLSGPDPVDAQVERVLRSAVVDIGVSYELRFVHEPPPRRVAMQRLAHLAGLAHLGPAHMLVHPEVGPWLALRAALVLAIPWSRTGSERAPDPCTPCTKPCLQALEGAIEASRDRRPREVWQSWLAVRDACPEGRPARYSEEQILYHYAGDRAGLPDTGPPHDDEG